MLIAVGHKLNAVYLTDPYFAMVMKALQESAETQNLESCPVTPLVTEQLWVEKYSPNSFTELLSDEHTNREVNVYSTLLKYILINKAFTAIISFRHRDFAIWCQVSSVCLSFS